MALFKRRDIEQYTNSLAAYLPGDELFVSKSIDGSTLRKLLRGFAGELFRCNGLIKEYSEEIIPDETVKFISEWESAVGIPDDCFPGTGDIETRRLHVLVKLASLGVQTAQDFIDLAALFGITVNIVPGIRAVTFPLLFPVTFFETEKEARFTIIVQFLEQDVDRFPFTFPVIFGTEEIGILECLFNKLKPANVNVLFQQLTPDPEIPPTNFTFQDGNNFVFQDGNNFVFN